MGYWRSFAFWFALAFAALVAANLPWGSHSGFPLLYAHSYKGTGWFRPTLLALDLFIAILLSGVFAWALANRRTEPLTATDGFFRVAVRLIVCPFVGMIIGAVSGMLLGAVAARLLDGSPGYTYGLYSLGALLGAVPGFSLGLLIAVIRTLEPQGHTLRRWQLHEVQGRLSPKS
jgi:hypothetical protein